MIEYQDKEELAGLFREFNYIIYLDMSHNLVLQWLVDNQDSIDIINELLEKLKS